MKKWGVVLVLAWSVMAGADVAMNQKKLQRSLHEKEQELARLITEQMDVSYYLGWPGAKDLLPDEALGYYTLYHDLERKIRTIRDEIDGLRVKMLGSH